MGNNWNPTDRALNSQRDRRSGKFNERAQKEVLKKFEDTIVRKIRTSFIGALDVFETAFGFLWGHNKPLSKLTEGEKEYRQIWEDVRKRVLDKGNGQIRGMEKELDSYDINLIFKESMSEYRAQQLLNKKDTHNNGNR